MASVVPGNEQDQPGYQMPGLAAAATSPPQLGPITTRNQAGQLVVYDPRQEVWRVAPDDGAAALPAAPMVRGGFEPPTASPAPLDHAGVPVPPSLVPIYKRESGFDYTAQNPTSSAAGAGQDIDSTWREGVHALGYGDQWKHAKDAPPEVQNAVNIWLQGRYGNKPWAASDPATHFGQAYQEQSRRDYEQAHQNTQTVLAELNKASPGTATYQKLIGQALERSDELQREFMNTMRHPPVQRPADAMANFGSLATVIGIFGGLFSRRPLTAALNAAGAGMEAINAGNHEAYQRAYDTWKTQTTLLHEILNEQNSQIRNVLELEGIDEREKMDRINILATQFGQDRLAAAAMRGDQREVYAISAQAQKLPGELAEQKARIDHLHAQAEKDRQAAMYGGTEIDRQATDLALADPANKGKSLQEIMSDPATRSKYRVEAATQLGEARAPGEQAREAAKADNIEAVLDEGDNLLSLLDKSLTVGLGGRIMRPAESIENMLGASDDTTRRDVESTINLLKIAAGRLLTDRSIVNMREATEINSVIRGLSMGDTIQNTRSAILRLQKFIIEKNQTLLQKKGRMLPPDADIASPPAAPPATVSPADQPWLQAPLAR